MRTPHTLRRARQPGQALAEFAVVLVLIALLGLGGLSVVGNRVATIFEEANTALQAQPSLPAQPAPGISVRSSLGISVQPSLGLSDPVNR